MIDTSVIVTVVTAMAIAAVGVVIIVILVSRLDKFLRRGKAIELVGRESPAPPQPAVAGAEQIEEKEPAEIVGEAKEGAHKARAQAILPRTKRVAARSLPQEDMLEDVKPLMGEAIQAPYVGEVEIVLDTSLDAPMVYELYNALMANPDTKIIRIVGTLREGNTVAVSLTKSLPLVALLKESLPDGVGFFTRKEEGARIMVSLRGKGNSQG